MNFDTPTTNIVSNPKRITVTLNYCDGTRQTSFDISATQLSQILDSSTQYTDIEEIFSTLDNTLGGGGTTIALSHTPSLSYIPIVYSSEQYLHLGIDYTITGNTLIFVQPFMNLDQITVKYRY